MTALDAVRRVVEYVSAAERELAALPRECQSRERDSAIEELQAEALASLHRCGVGAFTRREAVLQKPDDRDGRQQQDQCAPTEFH